MRRGAMLAGVLALVVVAPAGAGHIKAPPKRTIAFVVPALSGPVFSPMVKGAQAAAARFGFRLKIAGGGAARGSSELQAIKTAIDQHANAIAVVPSTPQAVVGGIDAAARVGLPVATVGLDVPASRRSFYYGPGVRLEGQLQGQHVLAALHARSKRGVIQFVITSCLPGAPDQAARRAGFEAAVRQNPYAGEFSLKEVGYFDTTTDPDRNLASVDRVFRIRPRATVAYALCGVDTESWGLVLKRRTSHRFLVAGQDWQPDILNLIGTGWIAWTLGESNYDLGYRSTTLLYLHVTRGQRLPTGHVASKSVFVTKANLAQVRASPDLRG